jgi:uncharacterized damage-inducible protein DinB
MLVSGTDHPNLVALSILLASFASYTALDLGARMGVARDERVACGRWRRLSGGGRDAGAVHHLAASGTRRRPTMAKTDDVKTMIKRLQDSFSETLHALYDVPPASLQQPCAHGCARGGTARDLLVHNIFHEKQHTGQVWSVRDQLRLLPGWGRQDLPTLLADYYTSRAQLIAALFGLADDQLDAKPPDGGWSIRETIDHVLYWDRDSIDTLRAELQQAAGTVGSG